jgi:hypothetical protein
LCSSKVQQRAHRAGVQYCAETIKSASTSTIGPRCPRAVASPSAMSGYDTKSIKPTLQLVHRAIADALGLRRLQDQRVIGVAPADPLRSVGDTAVEVTGGPYEEADITEEWCEDQMAAGLTLEEPKPWIREENSSGVRRQKLLSDPQQRSTVRKEMRAHLRYLRGA